MLKPADLDDPMAANQLMRAGYVDVKDPGNLIHQQYTKKNLHCYPGLEELIFYNSFHFNT